MIGAAYDAASTKPGFLPEAARLYIRSSGRATLNEPRHYLADFPKGAMYIPLRAEGVEFELVSATSNASLPGLDSRELDATAIDSWIEAVSRFPAFSVGEYDGDEIDAGQEKTAEPETRLIATRPLWLVASQPLLSLPLTDGSDGAAIGCLPVFEDLYAVCLDKVVVRALETEEFVREFGTSVLEKVAVHIAEAVATWFVGQRQVDEAFLEATAAYDAGQMEIAYHRIASVAEPEFEAAAAEASKDPLLAAIGAIGRLEDFAVRAPPSDDIRLRFQQRLERVALASNFRYREVSLEGTWWREDGPPILVWHAATDRPMVALWSGKCFRLLDPLSGEQTPIDKALASEIAPGGFMLYPCLPDDVTMKTLRRFALHNSKGELRGIMAIGGLATLIGFLVPIATGVIVSTAIPDGRLNLTMEMALIVGAAAIGVAGFTLVRSFATIRASSLIDMRVQAAIWDRILRLPPKFFRGFSTGDLVQRVLAIDEVRRLLTGPVLNGLLSGLFASASFVLMLFYDLRLALYGFAFAMLTVLGLLLLARRQLVFTQAARELQGKVTGRVIDILSGVAKLRVAAAEERAFGQWAERFTAQRRAVWQAARVRVMQSVVITMLPPLGILGMFIVAGYRSEPIDLAAFSAFNIAFGQFTAAVSGFGLALGTALDAIPLITRITPILEARPEVDKARADPGSLTGRIAVREVSFRYRDDGPTVLDGIDFTIEPHEFIAVVGPSGSGKSTLLRLLLGFETPSSGAIFYDNRDLAKLDLRLVRRQIGTVLQNAGLVPGNLFENIAGAAPLTDEEVMAAAGQAGLAEDIENLPMGLETMVSEGGGTLSGGQRQRIMIARALVGKPRILFFDEATSALDNRTQAIVGESLGRLKVTRLVIAHRLSTIRDADRILVIEHGRLVEQGSYEELMEQRGTFYQLARRQLI